MATKPNEGHLDWISDDDGAKYAAPSSAKRLQGWLANEKPPFQYFNWAWRLIDRWLQWAEAQSDENVAAIAAEQTARINADNTLQANIDTEAASRASADATLQTNINAEAAARAGADNTLQTNINAEAAARASADNSLQADIDGLISSYLTGSNVAKVTVGSGTEQLCTVDLGNVTAGDYGIVVGYSQMQKITNAGLAGIGIRKASGTGQWSSYGTSGGNVSNRGWWGLAGLMTEVSVSAPFRISTTGTLILELTGYSSVSSAEYQQNYLRVYWLRKH